MLYWLHRLVSVFAGHVNWSHHSGISTMLVRWHPKVGPSSVAWWTCCAPLGMTITRLGWTRSSSRIKPGCVNYGKAGMASVSSRCHNGPSCLTSRCHLKQKLQKPLPIAYIELFSVVVAAHLWGPQWTSRQVESVCDNMSVVAVLSSGTSREGDDLLPYLALLAVRHLFSFTVFSVCGTANPVPDALSRFQFQAEQSPTPILQGLLTAL